MSADWVVPQSGCGCWAVVRYGERMICYRHYNNCRRPHRIGFLTCYQHDYLEQKAQRVAAARNISLSQ